MYGTLPPLLPQDYSFQFFVLDSAALGASLPVVVVGFQFFVLDSLKRDKISCISNITFNSLYWIPTPISLRGWWRQLRLSILCIGFTDTLEEANKKYIEQLSILCIGFNGSNTQWRWEYVYTRFQFFVLDSIRYRCHCIRVEPHAFQFFVLDSWHIWRGCWSVVCYLSILCIGFWGLIPRISMKLLNYTFNSLYWIPCFFSSALYFLIYIPFNSLYWIPPLT